jgi:hypothetical protein
MPGVDCPSIAKLLRSEVGSTVSNAVDVLCSHCRQHVNTCPNSRWPFSSRVLELSLRPCCRVVAYPIEGEYGQPPPLEDLRGPERRRHEGACLDLRAWTGLLVVGTEAPKARISKQQCIGCSIRRSACYGARKGAVTAVRRQRRPEVRDQPGISSRTPATEVGFSSGFPMSVLPGDTVLPMGSRAYPAARAVIAPVPGAGRAALERFASRSRLWRCSRD